MTLRFRALCTALPLLAGTVTWVAPDVHAQDVATLTVDENFRREPNGVILARLSGGAPLRVIEHEGPWTQVALSGWVWMASLSAAEDPAFDLAVSVEGGENLRLEPSGTIVGRLEEGILLSEVTREPSWAQVSRVGWIWSASLDQTGATPQPAVPTATPSTPAASRPAARVPGGFTTVGSNGGPILTAPDGDTLAVAAGASEVEVTAREGNWARVRVEGWMWMPAATEDGTATEEAVALVPDDLVLGPDDHEGRVVSWTLQFISLERAEAVRTDFFEGEPFLLTRFGGSDGAFVYVSVPTDRLTEVEGLVPLERVSVTGRIRTAASTLTGAPILDLLSIERTPRLP